MYNHVVYVHKLVYEGLHKYKLNNIEDSNVNTEAATGGKKRKKVFLEILQSSQESTCSRVSFLIKFRFS